MELDPFVVAGLAIGLVLVVCVAILAAIRDRRTTPERLVTRSVRCPERQETAVATFREHMRTGLVERSLHSCSLLDVGERCDATCAASVADATIGSEERRSSPA